MKPRRFAVRFAGLVLALVLAISCGGAPGSPSAEEILAAADEAQHNAGTAHFDVDMKITIKAEGMTVDATAKYVGDIMEPDRFKGTIEASVMGENMTAEMVSIGNTTYTKDYSTTGTWETTTEEEAGWDPQELIPLKPEGFKDLKLVGEEDLSGRPVYHVSGKVIVPLGLMEGVDVSTPIVQVNYWIDKETSHLLKGTMIGHGQATIEGTDTTVDLDITIFMSGYGEPVTIEPPL